MTLGLSSTQSLTCSARAFSSRSIAFHQYFQSGRIVIERGKGAADGAAWQQIAGFIFLESPRTTADNLPGALLSQTQLAAYPPNFLRVRQAVDPRLEAVQHSV